MASTIDKDLFDRLINRQIAVGRYAEKQAYDIIRLLNRSDKELLDKIMERGESETFTARRLEALLKETRSIVDKSYRELFDATKNEMEAFALHAAEFAGATLATQLPISWSPVAISSEQLIAIVDKTPISVGKDKKLLLEEVFQSMAANKEESIRGALRLGMVQGETVDQLTRRLKGTRAAQYKDGILEGSRRSMQNIVRSVVQHTNNTAVQATYAKNKDVVKGWVYVASLDSRTCSVCFSQSGKTFPLGEGPLPIRHVSCLPGDSLVTPIGRVLAVSKRWYDGNLVTVKTSSGKTLSGTPNHPVLTPSGWVAIGSLDVGGNVICHGGVEFASVDVDGDNKNVPALIKDIAEAFLNRSEVISEPVETTSVDFHGDGAGSKVAIIGADRQLLVSDNPPFGEHFHELKFVPGNNFTSGFRSIYKGYFSGLVPSISIVSSFRQRLSFLRSSLFHPGKLLFASTSKRYPIFNKKFLEVGSRTLPKFFSHATDTNSGFINFKSSVNIHGRGLTDHRQPQPFEYTMGRSFAYPIFRRDFGATKARFSISDYIGIGRNILSSTMSYIFIINNSVNRRNRAVKFFCDFFKTNSKGIEIPNSLKMRSKPEPSLFRLRSDLNPTRKKSGGNARMTDSELASYLSSGKSGQVFTDDIVDIERREFHGHVYNLQTESNSYVAEGIITHNCRCFQAPNIKTWKELGFDDLPEFGDFQRASKDGPVDAKISFDSWLKTQDKQTQTELLGPARQKLFAENGLKLDKLVDSSGKLYTLDELKAKM